MIERWEPALHRSRVYARWAARRARTPLVDMRRRVATGIGAVALALVALAFAYAGDQAQRLFGLLVHRWPLIPLLLTPAMFAGVVAVTRAWLPRASGSGIPQVIAAARAPSSPASTELVSVPTGLGKLGLSVAMLGAGASVGREGPTVQVAAAVMVAVHRVLRVRVSAGVLIAGGAAGVAAAFNTPLAGVAFAIEELAAAYEQRVTLLVMGAVMIGGLVTLGIAGDYVYFGAVRETLGIGQVLLLAPIAGVGGGLLGGLFTRLVLLFLTGRHPRLSLVREHPVIFAAACGVIVAVLGIVTHGATWGTGYAPTRYLLEGNSGRLWFGPAKLAAALATTLSGAPGGIFAPSLAVGAGFGNLLTPLFPGTAAGPVILLGMVAYFVGVVRAPLTAVIIISEATANHHALLPLFATALIADAVSARVSPTRLYHGLARPFLAETERERAAMPGGG